MSANKLHPFHRALQTNIVGAVEKIYIQNNENRQNLGGGAKQNRKLIYSAIANEFRIYIHKFAVTRVFVTPPENEPLESFEDANNAELNPPSSHPFSVDELTGTYTCAPDSTIVVRVNDKTTENKHQFIDAVFQILVSISETVYQPAEYPNRTAGPTVEELIAADDTKREITNRIIAEIMVQIDQIGALLLYKNTAISKHSKKNMSELLSEKVFARCTQNIKPCLAPLTRPLWETLFKQLKDQIAHTQLIVAFTFAQMTSDAALLERITFTHWDLLLPPNQALDLQHFAAKQRNTSRIEYYQSAAPLAFMPLEIKLNGNIYSCIQFVDINSDTGAQQQYIFDIVSVSDVKTNALMKDWFWSDRLQLLADTDYTTIRVTPIKKSEVDAIMTTRSECVFHLKTRGFGIGTHFKYTGVNSKKRTVVSTDA
ncbi:MAG: hypothetical protein MUO31_07740 [Thermodesulfovibrionales bacterium]|nr:hypothetical protein [Thermodesulfovibrionales bacterium]